MCTWDPKDETVIPATLRKILEEAGGSSFSRDIRLMLEDAGNVSTTCRCSAAETRRRIPPSHGSHNTGRYPMGARGGPIRFESGGEYNAIRLLDSYSAVEEVWSQPLTVACFCHRDRLVYTVDLGVRFRSKGEVPPELKALGFEEITLIEVKPESMVTPRVRLKARLLEEYTSLRTVILTDHQVNQLLQGRARDVH